MGERERPGVDIEALVLAGGRGERLGLGPKALLSLGGRTLLDRAIEVMGSVARRVLVGVPPECVEEVRRLHGDAVVVLAGGHTRRETLLRLLEASRAPFIVQHDVVHPFSTPALTRRVVAAGLETGAAMAAVWTASHVYRGATTIRERVVTGEGLWQARKPFAFWRDSVARALDTAGTDAGSADLLVAVGEPIALVPAAPWNIKITTPPDWALARLLEPLFARGELPEASVEDARPP